MNQRESHYFTQHDWHSESLPPISWESMVHDHIIFEPLLLVRILEDAQNFLMHAEGPNLETRKKYVPSWFQYWNRLLQGIYYPDEEIIDKKYVKNNGLTVFDDVHTAVRRYSGPSGELNLAGGEGTQGHVKSYQFMRDTLGLSGAVVWAFERDSYFTHYKERPAPFLPLTVRLTMSILLGVDIVTVLPEVPYSADGHALSKHYKDVFDTLGVDYCFADELDPHAQEKIMRGKIDRATLIPHEYIPSTRKRVEKFKQYIYDYDELEDQEPEDVIAAFATNKNTDDFSKKDKIDELEVLIARAMYNPISTSFASDLIIGK